MTTFTRPTLVTLTAPTCSGKSYLLNELTQRAMFSRIVSTTTRAQRPGEKAGLDYDYITREQSLAMEANGEFFELIEFNGTRYGVTNDQMQRAMSCPQPPIVILEPQGLEIYRQKCAERGWDIFQVYVNTTEEVKLDRLRARTNAAMTRALRDKTIDKDAATNALAEHARRYKSITGDERRWISLFNWDAIVPGDDVEKAISMIEQGIKWRNRRLAEPKAFDGRVVA